MKVSDKVKHTWGTIKSQVSGLNIKKNHSRESSPSSLKQTRTQGIPKLTPLNETVKLSQVEKATTAPPPSSMSKLKRLSSQEGNPVADALLKYHLPDYIPIMSHHEHESTGESLYQEAFEAYLEDIFGSESDYFLNKLNSRPVSIASSISSTDSIDSIRSNTSQNSVHKKIQKKLSGLSQTGFSDTSVGDETIKHFKDQLRTLYGGSLLSTDQENEALDRVIDHLIQQSGLKFENEMDPTTKEILERFDPHLKISYRVLDPDQSYHVHDTTGIDMHITLDQDSKGWVARLTLPDGTEKVVQTKKSGAKGFEKLVEKIEVIRLVQILRDSGISEISFDQLDKESEIKNTIQFIQWALESVTGAGARGASLVGAGVVSEGLQIGADSLKVVGAVIELRKAAKFWSDYKEHLAYAKELRVYGKDEEAERIEHLANKFRRKCLGRCGWGTSVFLARSLYTAKTAISLAHVSQTMAPAVMATGVGAGVFLALSGSVAATQDIHGLVNSGKNRKLLKELKAEGERQLEELEASNTDGPRKETALLLRDFSKQQLRRLNAQIARRSVSLSGDTALIAGGALTVAAAVMGASSMGVGAGAAIGGAAVIQGGVAVGVYVDNYIESEKQKELEKSDPFNSTRGILTRLHEAVKAEQSQEERPLTKMIVEDYMHLTPSLFLHLTEPTAELFSPVLDLYYKSS